MSGIFPVDDVVTRTIVAGLDGIAARQRVIAGNIANAATPGYIAKDVQFESSLRAAVRAGHPEFTQVATTTAGYAVKQDGNSVDMTAEMTKLDQTSLMYDALVNAMNFKMNVVKGALSR